MVMDMISKQVFKSIPTLAEVKGIRKPKGRIRLTGNEFEKVKEFQSDFILSLVTNLDDIPKLVLIDNPLKHFQFKKNIIKNEITEYRSLEDLYQFPLNFSS